MHNLQQTESCPKFTSAIHTISDWAKYESDLCLQIYSWHLQWVSPGTWLHESSRHRYTCKHIIGYQDPLYWIWCINRNNWICKWQFQGSVHMMDSTLERFVKQLWNIVAHPCLWLSSILVDPGVVLKHRRYYSLHGKTLPDPFLCGLLCSTFYCQVLQFPWEKNCCKCDDMQQLSFGFVLWFQLFGCLDVFCSLIRWAVQYMSYQGATINHGHPIWVWIWTTTHLVRSTEAQGRRDIEGVKYMRLYTCHDTCII